MILYWGLGKERPGRRVIIEPAYLQSVVKSLTILKHEFSLFLCSHVVPLIFLTFIAFQTKNGAEQHLTHNLTFYPLHTHNEPNVKW